MDFYFPAALGISGFVIGVVLLYRAIRSSARHALLTLGLGGLLLIGFGIAVLTIASPLAAAIP